MKKRKNYNPFCSERFTQADIFKILSVRLQVHQRSLIPSANWLSPMIGMIGQNSYRPVNLFRQHDPG